MIKAAICGIGNWGQKLVNSVQGKSEKIRFVAGIAGHVEKYRPYADKAGILLGKDYETVLADPAVDAVVLATPHSLHGVQIEQAAAAGKHVFVEKPFTLSRAAAEKAVQACMDAGVTLAAGHNRRFLPSLNDMNSLIAEGRIGRILHIEGQHSGPSGYRPKPGSWRGERSENPAGGMAPRGIHALDAMICLNGPVQSVFAVSERLEITLGLDDTTATLLRFKNGASGYLGTIIATANFWRLHVFGTQGWIEMHGPQSITIKGLDDQMDTRTYDDVDLERAELEAFAEAVLAGKAFVVPPEEVINGIAVMEAMAASATSGMAIEID